MEEHYYTFDDCFNENDNNDQIYQKVVYPIVTAAFEQNAKVTCFAYGQTGSGKTFTMMGDISNSERLVPGLYLLAAEDIFKLTALVRIVIRKDMNILYGYHFSKSIVENYTTC